MSVEIFGDWLDELDDGGTPQHVDTEILRSGEEMADINRDYRDDTNLSIPESECCVSVNSYAKKFSDIPIIYKKTFLNQNSFLP